ncbi:T9SS type A sorting domain-containing protein [Aureivirga marina]|uniref:T9SS type A sorting domain-containing protein n=1 Tax=Aureivirga marina TaxID=1182451 RepID=UPI0018C9E09A|nr:T9SS type A sorting domain-containing protein [Aureivirga marina]
MKKITLAIASIFALSNLQAQEFAPIGATWYYSDVEVVHETTGTDVTFYYSKISYNKHVVSEELEFAGQTCKKVDFYNDENSIINSKYTYEQDNKIYVYLDQINGWYTIVDFNLEVNETFTLPFAPTSDETIDSMELKVLSKETVIIDGEERIKMAVSGKVKEPTFSTDDYDSYTFVEGTFISGLGNIERNPLELYSYNDDIDQPYPNEDTLNYPIRCYSDENTTYTNPHDYYNGFYFDGSDCEAKVLDVDDFSETNLEINAFPNPIENFISISIQEKFDFEIFDIQGKSVLKGNAKPLETINLKKLEKGIYILNIKTSKQSNSIQLMKK